MGKNLLEMARRSSSKKRPPPCGSPGETCQRFREWYAYGLGQALAQEEQKVLAETLPTLFGYHLVQVGRFMDTGYLKESYIRHKIVTGFDAKDNGFAPDMYALPSQLPVQSDSVDVVILPHTLELDSDPHQVLREAERVLVPEGHVVVLVFNPWSWWGIRRLLSFGRKKSMPWCGRFISPMRAKDWLELLGFEVCSVKTFFHRPPIKNRNMLRRLRFIERFGQRLWPAFGGVTLYVAKKRVIKLTPIMPRWRRGRLLAPGLIETRESLNNCVAPQQDSGPRNYSAVPRVNQKNGH